MDHLFDKVDMAMYRAKEAKGTGYSHFDFTMHKNI